MKLYTKEVSANLANTDRQFGQSQFAIWFIPVGDFKMC